MDRASGAHIYNQVNGGLEDNPAWEPRHVDIVSSGDDTFESRRALYSQVERGFQTTYTADARAIEKTELFKHNIVLMASQRQPEGRTIPRGVMSYEGSSNNESLTLHAKFLQATTKKHENLTAIFTSNFSEGGLHGRRTSSVVPDLGLRNKTKYQNNTYYASKDTGWAQDAQRIAADLREGKVPKSGNDLTVSSPNDYKTLETRLLKAFKPTKESSSQVMYIDSATVTSPVLVELAGKHLKAGGTVKLSRSGDPETLKSENKLIDTLSYLNSNSAGTLMVGEYKDKVYDITHNNRIVRGDTISVGTARFSKSNLGNSNEVDVTAIFQNGSEADKARKKYEETYNYELVEKVTGNHFIDFVHAQKITNRVNIRVQAQVTPRMRQMVSAAGGISTSSAGGGVLSSSFVEYNSRIEGYTPQSAYFEADKDLKYLQEIEADWFSKRTWGETWGQLGNRGMISSMLIQTATDLNNKAGSWFSATKESVDARMNLYYRAKTTYESTVLPDIVRGGLDYFENMEMNILGFYTASTGYAMLRNTAISSIKFLARAVTGDTLENSKSTTGKLIHKILVAPGRISRSIAGDVSSGLMSRVAHALDVLMGFESKGSIQYAIDSATSELINLNKSTGDVTRSIMRSGTRVVQNNSFMRLTMVSFASEFFINMHRAQSKIVAMMAKGEFRKALVFTGRMVFKKQRNANSAKLGLRYSFVKMGSAGLFGIIMLDKITGYLGQHAGGIDVQRIDRANEILRNAAAKIGAGNITPVQMTNTGNVGIDFSDNSFQNTAKVLAALPRAVVYGMKAFFTDLFWGEHAGSMQDILGPDIVVKGQEMAAAQKAALMGNEKLAAAYVLLANQGADNFKDSLFKADMWRSWVVQATPNPMIFTFTWSMTQHRAGRSSLSHEQEDVQEFGLTLQGPVAVKIGWSVDLPFRFKRQLGKRAEEKAGYGMWAFEYKPGSSFASVIGATGFLHLTDNIFKIGAHFVSHMLHHTLSPFFQRRGMHSWAGVIRGAGELVGDIIDSDHQYMINPNKVGKGKGGIISVPKISPARALARILTLPATMPIYTAITVANMGLGLIQRGHWHLVFNNKSKFIQEFAKKADGSLTKLGSIFESSLKGNLGIDHITRAAVRELLDMDEASFHKEFGADKDFKQYKRSINGILRERTIRNPWNVVSYLGDKSVSRSTRALVASAHLGFAALTGFALFLAHQARTDAYSGFEVQANQAYDLANRFTRWAASKSADQVAALNNNNPTWLYRLASKIDYENGPDIFRGVLAFVRGGLLMFDTTGHSGTPNWMVAGAGVIAEGYMLAAAGLRGDEVTWDPITNGGMWRLKKGGIQTPGIGSTLLTWATGVLRAFVKGSYHPLGQDQYVMMGAFGLTYKDTDKDSTDIVGRFAQYGTAMFFTSGFSESMVLRVGWEKRYYQESKYAADIAAKPFGLRQRMRDRQIRSGKMYRDNVVAQATSWGLRAEIARRNDLFRWVKNVDARDLAFIPGLISGDKSGLTDKLTIRRFKEPTSKADQAMQRMIEQYSKDVVASGDKPGNIEELDEELDYQRSVLENTELGEKLGKLGLTVSMTPENFKADTGFGYKLMLYGGLAAAATIALTAGVVAGAKFAYNKLGPGVRQKLGIIGNAAEQRIHQQIARAVTPVAKMITAFELPGGKGAAMALQVGDDVYVKGRSPAYGSGMDEALEASKEVKALEKKAKKMPLSEAEQNLLDAAKERASIEDVFWSADDMQKGPLRPFYRMLNKAHGLSKQVASLAKLKNVTFLETSVRLKRLTANIAEIHKDLTDLRSTLEQLGTADLDDGLRASFEKGINRLEKLNQNLENQSNRIKSVFEHFRKSLIDPNTGDLNKLHTTLSHGKTIIDIPGSSPTSLLDELTTVQKTLENLTPELTKAMEEVGEIKRVGTVGDIRGILEKLGISGKKLDIIADMEDVIKKSTGSKPNSKFVDLSFVDESVEEFNRRLLTDVAQELEKDTPGAGKKLLEELIEGVDEGNSGNVARRLIANHQAGTSEDITARKRGKLTREEIKAVLNRLRGGKTTAEEANAALDATIDHLYSKHSVGSSARMISKGLFGGLAFRLGNVDFSIGLFKTSSQLLTGGLFLQLFSLKPLQTTAYYATRQNLKENTEQQRYEYAVETRRAWIETVAGTAGTIVGSGAGVKLGSLIAGGVGNLMKAAASRILLLGRLANFVSNFAMAGGPVGIGIKLVSMVTIGLLTDFAVRKLMEDPESIMAQKGSKMSDPSYMGSLFTAVEEQNLKIFKYFQAKSRKILKARYTNKGLDWKDSIIDVLYFGIWNPNKLEAPGVGPIRALFDVIKNESESRGLGAASTWEYAGLSPSTTVLRDFSSKSVLFYGNIFDMSASEITKQQSLAVMDPEGWAHEAMHESLFGGMARSKIIGPNKDGSDPLGPAWIRDEFRSQMFKPLYMVDTSINAELARRGDLNSQVLSNIVNQRSLMGRVASNIPEYDPRSGGNLNPGAYLISVVDPTKFAMIFAEPKYSLESVTIHKKDEYAVTYNKHTHTGVYRGRFYPPISAKATKTTKTPPGKPKARAPVKASSVPIMSAMEIKMDPLLRALRNAALKVAVKAKKLEEKLSNKAQVANVYFVPKVDVKKDDAHHIATDTANKQHNRGNAFAERLADVSHTGLILGGHLTHDNHDIATSRSVDTSDTGVANYRTDTFTA